MPILWEIEINLKIILRHKKVGRQGRQGRQKQKIKNICIEKSR